MTTPNETSTYPNIKTGIGNDRGARGKAIEPVERRTADETIVGPIPIDR
jgi:hypothetical protein